MLESINLQQDIQNDNMNYFISKFIHNKKPSKCTPLNLKFSSSFGAFYFEETLRRFIHVYRSSIKFLYQWFPMCFQCASVRSAPKVLFIDVETIFHFVSFWIVCAILLQIFIFYVFYVGPSPFFFFLKKVSTLEVNLLWYPCNLYYLQF